MLEEQLNDSSAESTESPDPVVEETQTDGLGVQENAGESAEAQPDTVLPADDDSSDSEEGTDEMDSLLDDVQGEPKKDKVQRRIDRLTAEKKAAQERASSLERELLQEKSTEKKKDSTVEYTKSQLASAMKKAMEDQDHDLMMEIMDYRVQQSEKSLIKQYEAEKNSVFEKQKKRQDEWVSIVTDYSRLSEADEPELYPGSHKDLNINNSNSLLYRLANMLFTDPKHRERYIGSGGQKQAVTDALLAILRKNKKPGATKETRRLKKALAKEKRKTSLGSSDSLKAESIQKKQLNESEKLSEYLKERKTLQSAGRGGI